MTFRVFAFCTLEHFKGLHFITFTGTTECHWCDVSVMALDSQWRGQASDFSLFHVHITSPGWLLTHNAL